MQQYKIHFSFTEKEGKITLETKQIKAESLDEVKLYFSKKYNDFFMIDYEIIEGVAEVSEEKNDTPTRWGEIMKTFARYKMFQNKNVILEVQSLDKRSKYVLVIAVVLMLSAVGGLFFYN